MLLIVLSQRNWNRFVCVVIAMVQLPIFGKLGPESKQLFKTMPAAPGTVKAEIEEDHLDEIYGPIDKRLKMAEPAEQVSRFPLTKFCLFCLIPCRIVFFWCMDLDWEFDLYIVW